MRIAEVPILAYRKSLWWPLGPHRGGIAEVKWVVVRNVWESKGPPVWQVINRAEGRLRLWYCLLADYRKG
jgi:hypothetical protein